jgi:outer membrane protein TolC
VNVVSPSIHVQGAFAGSIPSSGETRTIALSLSDAVRRGLQFNLAQVGASNAVRQARAQRAQALAALLPSVSASLSETAAKVNLQAAGLSASTLSSLGPVASAFPTVVGPFHYYEAAANISASLFNLTSLHNLRAADANSQNSLLSAEETRQAVVLAVCGSYMQVLASEALVNYQQEQVRYAEASYQQAATQY